MNLVKKFPMASGAVMMILFKASTLCVTTLLQKFSRVEQWFCLTMPFMITLSKIKLICLFSMYVHLCNHSIHTNLYM